MHIFLIFFQFANYNDTSMLIWSQAKHVEEFMLEHKRHGIVNEMVIQLNKHRNEVCASREVQKGDNQLWNITTLQNMMQHMMGMEWTKYHLVIFTIEPTINSLLFWILLKKLHDFKWNSIDRENCIIKPKIDFFTHECQTKRWNNYEFDNQTHPNFNRSLSYLSWDFCGYEKNVFCQIFSHLCFKHHLKIKSQIHFNINSHHISRCYHGSYFDNRSTHNFDNKFFFGNLTTCI